MIIESLLALALSQQPVIHPAPLFGASFSSRSSSFSSSRSSFSSSRSSFSSSRPSFSSSSRPSFSSSPSRPSSTKSSSQSFSFYAPSAPVTRPSIKPAPVVKPTISAAPSVKPATATTQVESQSSVQRINKQVSASAPTAQSKIGATGAPKVAPVIAPPSATPRTVVAPRPISREPQVVSRETYVERYHDSGITGNPFFWMWALDSNRGGSQPQQPTQVFVKNTDGEQVKVPASQLVVEKNKWNPIREFFVFLLGGGIATGGIFLLGRPVLGRR